MYARKAVLSYYVLYLINCKCVSFICVFFVKLTPYIFFIVKKIAESQSCRYCESEERKGRRIEVVHGNTPATEKVLKNVILERHFMHIEEEDNSVILSLPKWGFQSSKAFICFYKYIPYIFKNNSNSELDREGL